MSKKYNIPLRKLHDKLKKMGLTQRQRKNMNTGLTGLPQMPHLIRVRKNPYKSLLHRSEVESSSKNDNEEESVESGPRKDLGAMPLSILPPHKLNMMASIRGEEKEELRQEQEAKVERSPLNLSSKWNPEKRMSEGR